MSDIPNTLSDNSNRNSKNTLSDFIEVNQKLLSVLGVFTALTVFTSNLPLKPVGQGLSFIFLALTLLIWTELVQKFPSGTSTWRLILFENLILFCVFGVFAYWMLAYREIWRVFIAIPLLIIFSSIGLGIVSFVSKKYNVFNRLFRTTSDRLIFLRFIGLMLIFILVTTASWHVSLAISPSINHILDKIYSVVVGTQP